MIARADFYESFYDRDGYQVPAHSVTGLTLLESVTEGVLPATGRYGADGKGTVRLPLPYTGPSRAGVWSADVVKLTYEEMAGPVYAWVDYVRPLSMVDDAEVCEVGFTVDPWRTWWDDVQVEEAHFTRVPTNRFANVPEQTYPVQYWNDVVAPKVIPESYVAWFVMAYVGATTKEPTVVYLPFRKSGTPYGATIDGYAVLELRDVYRYVQDAYGLQTEQIVFAGWTDWPVIALRESATTGAYVITDNHGLGSGTPKTINNKDTLTWFGGDEGFPWMQSTATASPGIGQRCVLKGYSDEVVDVLPWTTFNSIKSTLACAFSTFYVRIAAVEHVIEWQVPIRTIPLGKNALSDYVYSGQKEYELQTMQLDRDTALVRGMVSSVTGGAQTGAYGMIGANAQAAGATTPGGVARAGAAASAAPQMAALSAGAGIVGALADYGVSGWHDDKSMALKTSYMSKIGGVAMTGQGVYDLFKRRSIVLATQEPDPESKARWMASIQRYGLNDDGWRTPSTTSGWTWTGPWQCDSARIVRKSASALPSWALASIAGTLARGCYIG